MSRTRTQPKREPREQGAFWSRYEALQRVRSEQMVGARERPPGPPRLPPDWWASEIAA